MRRISSVVLFAFAAACEPGPDVIRTGVVWMDWPSQVVAAEEFSVRLVVSRPCALIEAFKPDPRADESAVTFAPYFLGDANSVTCVTAQSVDALVDRNNLDTTGLAPGLGGDARTYEMRGATGWYDAWVERTFGDVAVYSQVPPPSAPIRNAGGRVQMQVDASGCVRIRPAGLYGPGALMVLENQADTVGLSGAFVRGYLHYPAAPVCGEAQTFHLVSRN
jgi:hypothetical protein